MQLIPHGAPFIRLGVERRRIHRYTTSMIDHSSSIRCEIVSEDEKLRDALVRIAKTCAIDLKLSLPMEMSERTRRATEPESEAKITLSIPAKFALAHDSIWNLACRIACFCPQARITTQIESP